MLKEIYVKYIGRRPEWQDNIYHTGLYFVSGQVRLVPYLTARKLLLHSDIFAEAEAGDMEGMNEETKELIGLAQKKSAEQEQELGDNLDHHQRIDQMDKNSVATFIKTNFDNINIDRTLSIDVLREQAHQLVDQFGVG